MKRILIQSACLCIAAIAASCVVNTSGKLDSIGKTYEGYYYDATRPTTCLFRQNGKYYVKAPVVRFPASTKTWQPRQAETDPPEQPMHSRITGIPAWGYHEIFTMDTGSINFSGGDFHPILHASGSWIPAAQFEQNPFTVIGKENGIQHSREGDILNPDSIRIMDTHRSTGNILRLPLVLIAGCAIDLPGNILVSPFMLNDDEDDEDEDDFLDALIDDAIDKHLKKHRKHGKRHSKR